MVFSTLQTHEKEAFFSLLDEYFQSRPEIFANLSDGSQGAPAAVSAAMHRASDATSRLVSAGLRHAATSNNTSRPVAGGGDNANSTASESEISSVADRVAAFSLQRNSHLSSSASSTNNAERPSPASGLTTVKKMGDVDTSSAKNFFGSLRNSSNLKSAAPSPPPLAPPAFAQKKNSFAPPPVRRAASNVSPRAAAPEFIAPPPPPPRPRQHEEEEEEEEEAGDWADVIYDYDSGEPGDLKITEGDTVLITERTSEAWWTGEVNGRKGLFPASYVKLR
ncbi:hypothetical protein BYT27DRAFT_7183483 [Phlegmacium glaucopus]|nr:hypothetical protein BYT27DRAFT_7183483 [Phlegmacium glaucopus]